MTGAQTLVYTAAVVLTTMAVVSTVASWVIPEPMIQGTFHLMIVGAAAVTWIVLLAWVANSRHEARVAEQRRRARAAEYTAFSRRRR